ncbi:uncharacterized protein LW94_11084 [Fusarium fujikuroi]|nr:uncharacterized protein Y057_12711 [Fusarium fujikuroi]KLP14161.1 uncharacterized protein LW94_11084 [Fusarium fujikuroi]
MRFLSVFSLLLSVASADRVSLTFTLDPGKNMSSLVLYRMNGAVLMGRCGRRINTRVPIDFSEVTVNVDGEGRVPPFGNYNEKSFETIPVTSGNFTVGDATYAIHPNPLLSGGPSCKTDVDSVNNRISVYCRRLYWDYTDIISDMKTADTDCFGPFPPLLGEFEKDYYTKEEKQDYERKSVLIPKIGRRCKKDEEKKPPPNLDGAGWPHQRYLFQQISDVMECGKNHTCSACSDNSKNIAYGFTTLSGLSFSSRIGGKDSGLTVTRDITHGFSVTRSWTVGNSYSCPGNPGDQVCVWYRVAHTAWTVRERDPLPLRTGYTKQTINAAPNRRNEGGGVVCRYNNECRSKGDKYWDCYGRKDAQFRYCPPPGYPPKLHLDPGPLPQDREFVARAIARLEKKQRIIGERGENAWAYYERKERELEKRLKMEYAEKWRHAIQQEKEEMEIILKEEKEAEKERKKQEQIDNDRKKYGKKSQKEKEIQEQMDKMENVEEVLYGGIDF